MINKYIRSHWFGYGSLKETEIRKLELRNLQDLKDYVKDALDIGFSKVSVSGSFVVKLPMQPDTKIVFEII